MSYMLHHAVYINVPSPEFLQRCFVSPLSLSLMGWFRNVQNIFQKCKRRPKETGQHCMKVHEGEEKLQLCRKAYESAHHILIFRAQICKCYKCYIASC